MDDCLAVTKRERAWIPKAAFHPENEKTKITICHFLSKNSFNGATSEAGYDSTEQR